MTGTYTWAWLALMAAVLWGLQYALFGQVAKQMDAASMMFWYSAIATALFGMAVLSRDRGFEIQTLLQQPTAGFLLAAVFIGVLANLGIVSSMQMKNVTAASMIECSYPLFTGLFTWLIFRNLQFNAFMLLGLAFVLIGVGLVVVAQE